eukprot:6177770-Pleurochrysis_carterae.AAC.1
MLDATCAQEGLESEQVYLRTAPWPTNSTLELPMSTILVCSSGLAAFLPSGDSGYRRAEGDFALLFILKIQMC